MVEFQPSQSSKGSYLDVGACYLWKAVHQQPFWSFDAVCGPRPWRDVIEGQSFAGAAMELATIAPESLVALREHNRSVVDTAKWLRSLELEGAVWPNYHTAMAFGFSGEVEIAQRHFRLAVEPASDDEWIPFRQECLKYAALVEDRNAFRASVLEEFDLPAQP